MSPALWGALAGAVFAGLNMIALWAVAAKVEEKAKGNEAEKTVRILKLVALSDLVLFPVIGYFAGPMVL